MAEENAVADAAPDTATDTPASEPASSDTAPQAEPTESKEADDSPASEPAGADERDTSAPEKAEAKDKPADEKSSGDGQPKLKPETVARLKDLGFSDEDAETFKDEAAAEHAAMLYERKIVARFKAREEAAKPTPAQEVKPEAKPQPKVPEKVQETVADDFPLDEERLKEYDDAIAGPIRAAKQHLDRQRSEIQALKEQVGGFLKQEQTRAWTRQFDTALSALGPETEAKLGKGTSDDLDPNSEHFTNRMNLEEATIALGRFYQESGQKVPLKTLVQRAYAALNAEDLKKQARKEIAAKLDKQKGAATNRVTSRASTTNKKPSEFDRVWERIRAENPDLED